MTTGTSRRGFFKHAAAAAGALGLSRFTGPFVGDAHAAPGDEPGALFLVNLAGGYNALFGSADSFENNAFGVTTQNLLRLGNGLVVDRATLGALPVIAREHMASIGCAHGISSHASAQPAMVMDGTTSRLVKLATVLPSTAAVRACVVGARMPDGNHRAIGDVSLQQVRDLSTTIAALGGSTSATAPDRALAANGILAAQAMSQRALTANARSGTSLAEAYPAAAAQLQQNAIALNYAEMAADYGVAPNADGTYPTEVRNPRTQIMAAELMIRAGATVVTATLSGWDTHGDRTGARVRGKFANEGITEALQAFTRRTMAMTNKNVVTAIIGDFSRSLPGSDHQANLTATVIGKYVKLGTTGRVNARVGLPAGTPGIDGLWAYLAAVTGATGKPFGTNPHTSVTLA